MNKRQSSRLNAKKKKRLLKQMIILWSVSIIILVLFIFIIMPGAIRLFFKIIDKTAAENQNKDDIPPQVPFIAAPPDATNSAQIKLSGYGEADSELIFIVNGNQKDKTRISADGSFNYELKLESGDNEIEIYSVDEAGNESRSSKIYNVILDRDPPELELEKPKDGDFIQYRKNQNTQVEGKTEAKAKIYLNGKLIFADSEGNFYSSYRLDQGKNELKFEIYDQAGNLTEKEIEVEYKF